MIKPASLLLIFAFNFIFVPNSKAQLDKEIFTSKIDNKVWSCTDSSFKKDYEMFSVTFLKDTIGVLYISVIEGLTMCACNYKIKFYNNFFEITSTTCFDGCKLKYLYGYLDSGILKIRIDDKKQKINPSLKTSGEWVPLVVTNEKLRE